MQEEVLNRGGFAYLHYGDHAMNRLQHSVAAATVMLSCAAWITSPVLAGTGTISKWSQLPQPDFGENVWSDVDWRNVPQQPPFPTTGFHPNWVIGDDFISNGLPILTVRWWGSYINPGIQPVLNPDSGAFEFGAATIEDGFVLSFHSDIPAGTEEIPFSRPGDLLGTYVAPLDKIRIRDMGFQGWDGHNVWQYEVDLMDTHLDHAIPGLSEPNEFLEIAGEIYWLTIQAENGHEFDPATWQAFDNGDPFPETEHPENHWWGWHTSPDFFNDVPVMGHLYMPSEVDWLYGDWIPAELQHNTADMAFELLTVPEPSAGLLGILALVAFGVVVRRCRSD